MVIDQRQAAEHGFFRAAPTERPALTFDTAGH
jgi:hypothetical protein